MPFNAPVIDVSVYQGQINWQKVRDAGIYAAVIRAGYGRLASQADKRFAANYDGARAAGLPVGIYWYSYADTPDAARLEAQVCLQVLAGRELQMPLYFDQEESRIPAAVRTDCAVAFLDTIRADGRYLPGYYTYTSYFASVDLATIQAHADTLWLADYRTNYDKTIPRDMHQYTSSGSVAGIAGRVDRNHLYRDFPGERKETTHMYTSDTLKIGPASAGDRKNLTSLAESLAVAVRQEGDCLIIGPMSAGDRSTISSRALALGLPCVDYFAPAEEPETTEDAPAEPEQPTDGAADPQQPAAPAVDLTEILAALGRIETAQTTQTAQLTQLLDKLTAAGAALAE